MRRGRRQQQESKIDTETWHLQARLSLARLAFKTLADALGAALTIAPECEPELADIFKARADALAAEVLLWERENHAWQQRMVALLDKGK